MMLRLLYNLLLWCHPPSFRRRFSSEMLWIFDEAAARQETSQLFLDGLRSVLRQWFLRSGFIWKLPLAVLGGLLAPLFGLGLLPALRLGTGNIRIHSLQSLMILTALSSMLVITLTVVLTVSWFRFIQKRRA